MKRYQTLMLAAVFGLAAQAAQAQEKLKIGVLATLSGPPAVLGQQLRNGVQLAVKTLGGKFGGGVADGDQWVPSFGVVDSRNQTSAAAVRW